MKKEDFHKGQTVWVYLIGNAAIGRKTIDELIQECEVVTVGRKYITARPKGAYSWEQRFDIENNFRHVSDRGTEDYVLYLTKEEIYERIERNKYRKYIQDFCGWDRRNLQKLSDDDLHAVVEIFRKYE